MPAEVAGPASEGNGQGNGNGHRHASTDAVAGAVADTEASEHTTAAAAVAVASAERAQLAGVSPDDSLVSVQLLAVPVELYARARDHDDDLLREFKLMTHGGEVGAGSVPSRLVGLFGEIGEQFSRFSDAGYAQLDAAVDAGEVTADVVFHVPAAAGAGAGRLAALLEEADAYCRSGALLTMASPPEIAAFRRWMLGEFQRQTAGGEPVSWPAATRSTPEGG
jgi:hypothetical protein